MALRVGSRLGPYEILGTIGAGGMGEVYRARDTRLARDVAIKILPDVVELDPRRRSQFEHEAQVLASLNHPHIAQVYGLEEAPGERAAGVLAIAMELVDGETLEQRISRGAMPIDDAIAVFQQVAAGLEAAHAKGIVHRDLKPSNIKITPDGWAKVLDFGIATRLAPAVSESFGMPTITAPPSSDATPGTPAYMSPEQIRGRPVDRRTDIWAFGCCLYEALTGSRPFGGNTIAEVFASILSQEPDWSDLPAATPAPVRLLLRRCLHKDPERRLRDAGDAWIDSEDWAAAVPFVPSPHVLPGRIARATRLLPWLIAAGLAVAVIWLHARPPTEAGAVRHLFLLLPESTPLALASWAPAGEGRPSIALSPDGRTLVYTGVREGQPSLFERRLDSTDDSAIPGTAGAFNPFFSPDGRWVGFFADNALKKVQLRGQQTMTLCPAPNPYGAVWHPDGTIYFASSFGRSIMRVSENGGAPQVVVQSAFQGYNWPELLPTGTHLLATRVSGGVVSLSIKSGEETVLVSDGSHARYVPTGHLVYMKDGVLLAARFDPARLAMAGGPVPVLAGIRTESRGGAQLTVAADGTLVYLQGTSAAAGTLVRVDRRTRLAQPLAFPVATYGTFQVAPDGHRLVIEVLGPTHDLWLFNLERAVRTKLTFESNNSYPVWGHDGRTVYFASDRDGTVNLFRTRADAPERADRLLSSSNPDRPYWASRDGKWLLFVEGTSGDTQIMALPLLGPESGRAMHLGIQGSLVSMSPDGRWVAYTSEKSGRSEVYLRGFPDAVGQATVSTAGGEEPLWSSRGDELFYRNGQEWMVVAMRNGSPLPAIGEPQVLFQGEYLNVPGRSYDVMPDGQSFILIRRTPDPPPTRLNVVLNWFEELRRAEDSVHPSRQPRRQARAQAGGFRLREPR